MSDARAFRETLTTTAPYALDGNRTSLGATLRRPASSAPALSIASGWASPHLVQGGEVGGDARHQLSKPEVLAVSIEATVPDRGQGEAGQRQRCAEDAEPE